MSKEKPTPVSDHEEAPEFPKIDIELAKSLIVRAEDLFARGSSVQTPNEVVARMTPGVGFNTAHGSVKKVADEEGESVKVTLFQARAMPHTPKFAESKGTKVIIFDDGTVDARQEHWVPDNLDGKVPPEPKGKFDVTPIDADTAVVFVEEQLAAHQAILDQRKAA